MTGARSIKEWLKNVIEEEKYSVGKINIIFCDDDYVREINKNFLEHDYYTDVITFDMSEDNRIVDAEIYISLDTVRFNARSLKLKMRNELLRVIVHGILHLLGYDDKTELVKMEMTGRENYYLDKIKKNEF
jgi:probable rRNA maturation factor